MTNLEGCTRTLRWRLDRGRALPRLDGVCGQIKQKASEDNSKACEKEPAISPSNGALTADGRVCSLDTSFGT